MDSTAVLQRLVGKQKGIRSTAFQLLCVLRTAASCYVLNSEML